MIVAGWNNGKANNVTGGGYGIKISRKNRGSYFRQTWASVVVELGNENVVHARLSPAFWRKCPELRRKEIGKWMLDQGFAPWPKGRPPKFGLKPIGERRFRLSRL